MTRIPTHRPPTHPGDMLVEEFLDPMGMTQSQLAEAIHVSQKKISDIVEGHGSITPSIALRLAKYFKMSPDFWLNNQYAWDVYHTQLSEAEILKSIQPIES
jgi:antitoxin HigA-1